MAAALIQHLLPAEKTDREQASGTLEQLLEQYGFDRVQHEHIRSELKTGRLGLAQNALPHSTLLEDPDLGEYLDAREGLAAEFGEIGRQALRSGTAGILTLAGGAGTRWTGGAGVVKALHPFCRLGGSYRTFLEV